MVIELTFNILSLCNGMLRIAISMKQRQHIQALLPPVLAGQPTGAFREEEQRAEQDEGGNALKTPSETERGRAFDLRAAVRDEIHDQDTPFDGPLLNTDDASTNATRCQFCEIDRNLRGHNTDCEDC